LATGKQILEEDEVHWGFSGEEWNKRMFIIGHTGSANMHLKKYLVRA